MPSKPNLLFVIVLLAVAVSLDAQVPDAVPKKGLQGYWPFSGSAIDKSGNNYNGKVHGATSVADRFGNPDNAYAFDGKTNFISTNYKGVLGTQPRSVSFWIRTISSKNSAVISWGSNAHHPHSGHRFNCSFNYREPGATIDIADACITFEPNSEINDNSWHHFVFQFDTAVLNKVEVYQDGNLIKHSDHEYYVNTPINTLEQFPVIFGGLFFPKDMSVEYPGKPSDFDYFFVGDLDDIAIYSRTLTHKEILGLYRAPNPTPALSGIILRWLLIGLGISLGLLLIRYYIRMRIKRALRGEMEKNFILSHSYELQNKVLKAQMDPHFIFNSLNTIQQFIITGESDKAQQYLYKFSRLVRQMLESNVNDSVSLEEEIELLERYLEIESLRFHNIFNYKITYPENDDISDIFIPHFLIQPFIENAIWHALLPKQGDKQITIVFTVVSKNTLQCVIDDNGIGRKNTDEKKNSVKKKSLAISFIKQRLELMSKIKKSPYELIITDKLTDVGESAGTRVTITMPIL